MQVRLPAVTKANTGEAGADGKESGLFADVDHLEDGDSCHRAHLIFWKMGDSHLKSHLLTSVVAEVFYKEGEGNRTKRSREGVAKFSACRRAQCIPIRQVMVRGASSWFSHPGCTSSWLQWLKVSKSPGAGMPEGQGLYLLKLVPRILKQTDY